MVSIETQWDKIRSTMTKNDRYKANKACDAIEQCDIIELDTKDKEILLWMVELIQLYPTIDVAWNIRKANKWLRDNNKRRHNFKRFLNNWISRTADRS